jgi:hypothetical protein
MNRQQQDDPGDMMMQMMGGGEKADMIDEEMKVPESPVCPIMS